MNTITHNLKTLFALLSVLLLLSATPAIPQSAPKEKEQKVLICNSKSSYAYHNQKCAGLKRCKSEIKAVTVAEAKAMGKGKPCGYCYGR